MARFRKVDIARESYFSAVKRQDAPLWARWKFYPGAMFTLTTRVILLVASFIFLFLTISILCIGHNFDKGPIPDGFRKRLIKRIYSSTCGWGVFLSGMTTSVVHQEVDYSYYLGEGYQSNYKDIKKTSTLVCNHVSWLDPLILI